MAKFVLFLITAAWNLHFLHIGKVASVKVFRFQEDGVATLDSVALYQGELITSRHVRSLTICARFKIFFLHTRGTLFHISDKSAGRDWMLRAGDNRNLFIAIQSRVT
ncbi:hypothetical protein SK128_027948 [Halocaridina rubra]|uniref:Uncharacterized protein n=1 Tax=Halocaridina rubra TaxID=373956 RepID=A0AAN8XD43_HALRR